IHDICQIGPNHTGGPGCDGLQLHVTAEPDMTGMDTQESFAPTQVWPVNQYLAVKAASAHQCWVQHLGGIRSRDNNKSLGRIEPVHLNQQLVESLFPFVVTAAVTPIRTRLADGIEFVDEHDARSF